MAERLEAEPPEPVGAPHLLDAEVGQVLRRYERLGDLDQAGARAALAHLAALPITRYPHGPFVGRAYDLRANVTVYDGLYLALAEALDAVLVTTDAALLGVPSCNAAVDVLAGRR